MKQMNAEVIAVGTELLLGQISNTNGQYISEKLAGHGINVFYHTVVGDNLDRVKDTFAQAHRRTNIIIVCGGLGPTQDDMTREAFHSLTGREIVEDEASMEKITAYFQKNDTTMTENNRRQARVFRGADIIPNHVGMAPGMIVEEEGRIWVFLPGVPKEMKTMFTDEVIPYLEQYMETREVIVSEMLYFNGIGESSLEDSVEDMIAAQDNPTIAPLAQQVGIAIRLTAKSQTKQYAHALIQETKTKILERLEAYYIGDKPLKKEERVYHMLKDRQMMIASAESLTGGLFSDRLVSVPGASDIFQGGLVCYATSIKETVLGVSPATIRDNGTISAACAEEMAERAAILMDADIGISFTGAAGPETTEGKASGTVYIGLYANGMESVSRLFHFEGSRGEIREQAVEKGYELLLSHEIRSPDTP